MKSVSPLLFGAALSLAAASSAQANLIANGNFASGLTDWSAGTYWVVDSSNPDSPSTQDALGACSIFFTSDCLTNPATGGLSQTVTDVSGAPYVLSFAFAPGLVASSVFPATLVVDWGATQVFDESFTAPTTAYTDYTVGVTGTGSDDLTFYVENDIGASNLDNVSVTTPEPGSLSLLGGALVALGLRRRRRRRTVA